MNNIIMIKKTKKLNSIYNFSNKIFKIIINNKSILFRNVIMSREKGYIKEIEKTFENVEKLLSGMMKDRSVPRNIKRIAQEGINELHKENETPGVISSNVIYLVDDLSQDPNIPFHARTTIYRILSLLENIKD